ncbi:MAG: AMP-binding protein [Candidatus Thorarchaeota archaeon]
MLGDLFWQDGAAWPKNAAKSIEYPREPLFAMLDRAAEKSGNLPFTWFMGQTRTFTEVREDADRIASFLRTRGVKEDGMVAIFLPNVPHFPAIFFGTLKAGAKVVTCNPLYKAAELNHQLKDTKATVVFVLDHPTFTPTCYEAIKDTDVETVVVCSLKPFIPKAKAMIGGLLGKIPKSPYYEGDKTFHYHRIMSEYTPEKTFPSVDPDDTAILIYTGGTTGTPKGAELTHMNLISNVLQIGDWVYLEANDAAPRPSGGVRYGEEVFVGAVPWYHSYGLTLTLLMSVWYAGKLVCVPDPRAGNPPLSDLLSDLAKSKGTVLNCVPALYAGIANHPQVKNYDLSSISICSSGAAPLPPELAKSFEAVTGALLFEGYGLTETSPVTHINPTNRKFRKFGSIGLPVADTICKILDPETGTKELPIGEVGEIAIHGPQVMKGYYNQPEETKHVMREIDGKRYFLTGDIGHIDGLGYTYISDRKKQMINVGGLKAYPREIEDVLFENPKVKNAAVVGLPRTDDPSNEYPKAYIILKDGETATQEEIIEWCRSRMAGYKRPKEVEFVSELPLSNVGKVLRRELREAELKKRGLS